MEGIDLNVTPTDHFYGGVVTSESWFETC